jgi:hypothetical protein
MSNFRQIRRMSAGDPVKKCQLRGSGFPSASVVLQSIGLIVNGIDDDCQKDKILPHPCAEEDVEVRVLGPTLQTIVSIMRSSRSVPPVLTDSGEIRIPTIGQNRRRISEYTWTGQRRVVKQVESTCRPKATSVPPNLLFVTGCDRLGDGKWYRLLPLTGNCF